ncbi:gelsolin-related protein of 125 kDa [Drosophila subpulchrella]|uniref:gelsolin-related protein of 125 kDa n=1 Tax=Drosophila subpulchrella TaxID=1486046 RepID=UPI0018A14116|nr:gelsolin-related protein of 125 kDa [Drosophila subpulchrella]
MQRSLFKRGCSRALALFRPLKSCPRRSIHAEESLGESPVANSSCLDLLGRLLHGRLNLLGGRPVPPRFLPLLTGDRSLHFNADEDEEFRSRLAMQLKELREALQETQELRESQEEELQEELDEDQPYTTRSREISVEDLTDEELNEMREVRMSAGQDRDQDGGKSRGSEQPEASDKEAGEETAEAREPQDPQENLEVHEVREGDIEGVYWTGEGKRIVTQTPQRKTGHSGFIDGEGEEIPHEESSPGQAPPYHPPPPRAQATSKMLRKGGRKSRTSSSKPIPSDSDE